MRNAEKADNLNERIAKLIENITYQTFIYTSRGLFEKDKLIFICQMTIQVNTFFIIVLHSKILLNTPLFFNMLRVYDIVF